MNAPGLYDGLHTSRGIGGGAGPFATQHASVAKAFLTNTGEAIAASDNSV